MNGIFSNLTHELTSKNISHYVTSNHHDFEIESGRHIETISLMTSQPVDRKIFDDYVQRTLAKHKLTDVKELSSNKYSHEMKYSMPGDPINKYRVQVSVDETDVFIHIEPIDTPTASVKKNRPRYDIDEYSWANLINIDNQLN